MTARLLMTIWVSIGLAACGAPTDEAPSQAQPSATSWLTAEEVRVDLRGADQSIVVEGGHLDVSRELTLRVSDRVSVRVAGPMPLSATADALTLDGNTLALDGHVRAQLEEAPSK